MNIKERLKKYKALRAIHSFAYNSISRLKKNRDMKIFEMKSLEVMNIVQTSITEAGYGEKFYFACGTALGIFRDKKLLSRDMDLDLLVFIDAQSEIDAFRNALSERGIQLRISFHIDGIGCIQDAFECDKVKIDINYVKREDRKIYVLYNLPDEKNKVLYLVTPTDKPKHVQFEKMIINLPDNTEEYLTATYGKNWAIPDPNYIYWENDQVTKTNLKGSIVMH